MKYKWAVIVLFLFTVIPASSQDKEESAADSGFLTVEGLETWHREIDISGYPAGTYNIIVEGVDKAGNKYTEGPYNVFIDPDSDLPVVNVSNPEPGMKVNGSLNIIGTCVDDDGVESVELKLDDGDFHRAEGKDFWSLYLETGNLDDGLHTITARGIDIKGAQGAEQTVEFILDRSVPHTEILSLKNGALVNRGVVLQGRSSDLNGIEQVELSTDGGESYRMLYKRNIFSDLNAEFSLNMNTNELEDGPHIYWFKAADQTGSEGLTPFLFFVDNEAPLLDVIYPNEDLQVNGKFTASGSATDGVGVQKLEYRIGGSEPVEIPLTTGDPYWRQDFDFTGKPRADITFILTDRTGNSVQKRLQYALDLEGDKPVLNLFSPEPNGTYSDLEIAGWVSDDDAVKEVVYSLDDGEAVHVNADYSFRKEVEALSPGRHRLGIYAVDKEGTQGTPQNIIFSVMLEGPEISFDSLLPVEGEDREPFKQAMEIRTADYKSLAGSILFRNMQKTATYSLDGGKENPLPFAAQLKRDDGFMERGFSIPLDKIEPGYHSFNISVTDEAGLSAERSFFLMIRDPESGTGTKKLYTADERFTDGGKPSTGMIRLGEKNDEIVFYLDGERVSGTDVSGNADFLNIVKDGSRIVLKARGPGIAEDIVLNITTSGGRTHKIGPFNIIVDDTPPVMMLSSDPDGSVTAGSFELSGKVSDNIGLKELNYSLNGGKSVSVPVEDGSFSVQADAGSLADGAVRLNIAAVDEAGNKTVKNSFFRKDTKAPELIQITPVSNRSANGVITFNGLVKDAGPVESIEYSADGENFVPIDNIPFPVVSIDLTSPEAPEKTSHIFRVTDAAGNVSELETALKIDVKEDTPSVTVQIPQDGALVKSDFIISGMAFDDDEVASIQYRLDDGEFTEIGAGSNFEIPVSLDSLPDNEHFFELKAVDLNGVESEIDGLSVKVSKNEPVSSLSSPEIDTVVRGAVRVSGSSSDANGIEKVFLSFDNGNTFNSADVQPAETADDETPADYISANEVNWSYDLNTELLEDGSHSLLIKAVDNYGVEGIYTTLINIDNTAPVIELNGPKEGISFTDEVKLEGRFSDNIELYGLEVELQNLASKTDPITIELPLDELLIHKLDLSDFAPGWVNMRITAIDKTGNTSSVSRNILKQENIDTEKVSLMIPSKGARITGDLQVQGRLENFDKFKSAVLMVDNKKTAELEPSDSGYFSFEIEPGKLSDGPHELAVEAENSAGVSISSETIPFDYRRMGPWIRIENFNAGDFATDRPWVTGTAGYEYLESETGSDFAVDSVDVSLDNGKTFRTASGRAEWKFRLETQELGTGELWILARARFHNGSTAVVKTMVIVDETPPQVKLLAPEEGARFNETLNLVGTASDEYGIASVSAALREGNKSSYQVPSFIQGLYIDTHFLGATYAELGIGLTFFDDNVKLQVLAGLAPPGRFTGMVLGLKLLANIAVLPWEYFFGYDFRDLSSSFALGTTFEYFSMPDNADELFGSEGLVLGALVAQAEIVKFRIPELTMFSAYSAYAEMQFWFISSDVDAGVEPRLTFGLRTDVF